MSAVPGVPVFPSILPLLFSLPRCLIPPSLSFSHFYQHNYIARQLKARNTIGLMSQLPYVCCFSTHADKKSCFKPEIYTLSLLSLVQVPIPLFCQFPPLFFSLFITFTPPPIIPFLDTGREVPATETKLLRFFSHLSLHPINHTVRYYNGVGVLSH